MKKINLCLLLLAILSTTSCKDDEPSDTSWKTANEEAFNAISRNPEYTELPSFSNSGSIYYKVLKKGEGTKPIYYTSRVQTYYKGWFVAANPAKGITQGTVFDRKLFDDGTPLVVDVNSTSMIEGWKVALQYMVEGDKWEIWIPCQLGYGTTQATGSNIPGYTTLAFELEIVKVLGVDEF